MKNKIIKTILILTLLFLTAMQLCTVDARTIDSKVKDTIENFCKSLENDSDYIYNYIDNNNKELYDNIDKYIDSIEKLKFTTKDVTENDGIITVKGIIDAKGDNWNVEGFTVKFDLKKSEDDYTITDTDLFYKISPEHTAKFVGSILLLVFGIIGGVFLVTIVTIIIIVVAVTKKKKNS